MFSSGTAAAAGHFPVWAQICCYRTELKTSDTWKLVAIIAPGLLLVLLKLCPEEANEALEKAPPEVFQAVREREKQSEELNVKGGRKETKAARAQPGRARSKESPAGLGEGAQEPREPHGAPERPRFPFPGSHRGCGAEPPLPVQSRHRRPPAHGLVRQLLHAVELFLHGGGRCPRAAPAPPLLPRPRSGPAAAAQHRPPGPAPAASGPALTSAPPRPRMSRPQPGGRCCPTPRLCPRRSLGDTAPAAAALGEAARPSSRPGSPVPGQPRARMAPLPPSCPRTTAPGVPCATAAASWAGRCSPRALIGRCRRADQWLPGSGGGWPMSGGGGWALGAVAAAGPRALHGGRRRPRRGGRGGAGNVRGRVRV